MLRDRFVAIFPTSPLLDETREPVKTLTSIDHISKNIANQVLKFFEKFPQDFSFAPYESQTLTLRTKKVIAQMPRWPVYEPEKYLTSTDDISENIANQALKFLENLPHDFGFSP